MNIFTLLAVLGCLLIIDQVTRHICQTIISMSYHKSLVRINEINNTSTTEITFSPDFETDDDFIH